MWARCVGLWHLILFELSTFLLLACVWKAQYADYLEPVYVRKSCSLVTISALYGLFLKPLLLDICFVSAAVRFGSFLLEMFALEGQYLKFIPEHHDYFNLDSVIIKLGCYFTIVRGMAHLSLFGFTNDCRSFTSG